MLKAPRHGLVDEAAPGVVQRPEGALQQKRVTSHEPAREVCLIELLAERGDAERTVVAVHALAENAFQEPERMEHEVLAERAGRIGKAVREELRLGIEQESRRSDAVRAHHDDARSLLAQLALPVVVECALRASLCVQRDFAHARPRPELSALGEGLGPVSDVG